MLQHASSSHGISSWCGTIAIGLEMNPKFRRVQEVGFAFSYIVSGMQSSRVTKLPIAEWHRGLFMESLSVMVRSRKRRKVKLSRK